MGFISHHEIEQRLVRYRVWAVIVREFSMGDIFGPGFRVVSTEDLKICFDFLVYLFSFSIRLWIVSCGEGEVVFEEFFQFSGKGRGKLRAMVGDDFVVQAKSEEDFVKEKGSDPFGSNGFLSRAKNSPLSKPMVNHDQERVKAHRDRKIRDQITRDLLERARSRRFDWEKWWAVGCVLALFCWHLAQPLT